MTTRTPSIVSDVSAIEVASTILRRPAGAGRDGEILRAAVQRAIERRDIDVRALTRASRVSATRRISPWPGRKTRIEPLSLASARA